MLYSQSSFYTILWSCQRVVLIGEPSTKKAGDAESKKDNASKEGSSLKGLLMKPEEPSPKVLPTVKPFKHPCYHPFPYMVLEGNKS